MLTPALGRPAVHCIASPPATIFAARLGARAKQPTPAWKGARYALEFAAVWAFAASIRLLPRPFVLLLAQWLGDVAFLLLRHDRRVARANLDIVFRDTVAPRE